MSKLFLNQKIYSASLFRDAIINSANVYLTFGRVDAWANDAEPDIENASTASEYSLWRDIIGAKKITGNDVAHCVPRYDWSANTVYLEYDHTNENLYDANSKFYVLTSEHNVYKCISNNVNSNSTVMPTYTNPNTVSQTADGYVWKFLYTVSTAERIKFLTGSYMPVKTLTIDDGSQQWTVQQAAQDGEILNVVMTNPGSGYTNANSVVVYVSGDGTGATATANVDVNTNTITNIVLTNYGSGYTNASILILAGPGEGSGAAAMVRISPPGGHGSNPVYELGGKNLMLNPRLINSESDTFPVSNEFRQVALLVDPLLYSSEEPASNSAYSQTMDLTLSGVSVPYTVDEIVYQGPDLASATFSGRVVAFDSVNNEIRLINTAGDAINEPLIGANSSAYLYVSSIKNPDLKRFSGRALYLDNIEPITRNESQTEDFKIVLKY